MQQPSDIKGSPWLLWVYSGDLARTLDASTWLETTKQLRRIGWKVDLVSSGPAGQRPLQGVDVLFFPTWNVYLLRHPVFHLRVIHYILRHWKEIDVVLFHQIFAAWIMPFRLLSAVSRKHPLFVMDTRTVIMEAKEGETLRQALRRHWFAAVRNYANLLADGQTAITKRMADALRIPASKLWGLWPSAVDIESFSVAAETRHWPKENERLRIIYIGCLDAGRNLLALCEATDQAYQEGINVEFFMYGEGTLQSDLQAFCEGKDGRIVSHGAVPHSEVPGLLARAHIGALPFLNDDRYNVSSPIKLFEYMGAGLPILATKIPCHTDVIGDGAYAFWAEDGDVNSLLAAIRTAWKDRSRLAEMGRQAEMAANNWTYRLSASKLSAALTYGLSRRGHSSPSAHQQEPGHAR